MVISGQADSLRIGVQGVILVGAVRINAEGDVGENVATSVTRREHVIYQLGVRDGWRAGDRATQHIQ